MGVEADALFLYLPQLGQGEYLEAAAVGEDGAIPVHELVQAAQLLYQGVPRADMEVIGVGQLHLTADIFKVPGRQRPLYGPLGAHVHEHRGLDAAVGSLKLAPPGPALLFQ